VAIDRADFIRLTGDTRVNDLALHLAEGSGEGTVREGIEQIAQQQGLQDLIEFASSGQIRAASLRIFDRSFAVTVWLQGVAIGIGLFGVAASFSAQVLARRREFGLLAHLGLTRRQILSVVALEGLAWTCWAPWPAWAWAWRSAWCWCTWSTRRASTGPWTWCCPGCACWPCAPPSWWPAP
jgi:putative ABC transport system permease protein